MVRSTRFNAAIVAAFKGVIGKPKSLIGLSPKNDH
jgi:hypothetical protein